MLLIECGLVVFAILIGLIYPRLGSRWFERLESCFCKLAQQRPRLAVVVVGLAALAIRASLLPIFPIPEPVVHDEFGYLLAADTFSHGRLTNVTHPMWMHFETFSVLQKPTYQCYAQPAQGLILAAGRVIFGHPFWGVWLSAAIMCAAICWMLQGWLPPSWALLGGLIAIPRFATLTYWGNSYFGGAAGAIGGAMVLGALPRLKRSLQAKHTVIMALGLVVLANSRPYEGLVLSLPIAATLAAWLLGRNRPVIGRSLQQIIVPMLFVLALAAVGMGYYFWRVTGNPLTMPYAIPRNTEGVAPYFLFQSPRPELGYYDATVHRLAVDYELSEYHLGRTPLGFAYITVAKAYLSWSFYLGPVLTLPLVLAICTLPYGFSWKNISVQTRFLLSVLGIVLIGAAVETFFAPHYISPAAGAVLAVILVVLRRLRLWYWFGKPTGIFLTRAIPVICLITFLLRCSLVPLHIPRNQFYAPSWYQVPLTVPGRAEILGQLQQFSGPQLIIVRYEADHNPFYEWVHNAADIDHAKLVWARDMGVHQNEELIRYYKGRRVWLLNADDLSPHLMPYASQ
jgi:hypothetical protein